MLWTVLAVVAVLVVGLALYIHSRPDTFRVQRSIAIDAPPQKIYPLIATMKAWDAWSPWEKKDPAMKRAFSGPPAGVGAAYAWEGDKNVGQGRMEVIEAVEPSKVAIRLDFVKPFKANNIVEFTLAPRGGSTAVTWAMFGPSTFLFKAMDLVMNMDKMCGKDFEAGLADMKRAAEK
jgi:uncharacterized protein YndB with AHSA1/START domain